MAGLSCGANCGQWLLVAINVLFGLLGIALLVGGCLLKFGSDLIDVEDVIKDTLAKIVFRGLDQTLSGVLDTIVLIAIIAGAVIIVVTLLGCLGACCKWKIALIIYSVVLFLVLAAEVALIVYIVLLRNQITDNLKQEMHDTLNETYTNEASNEVVIGWNTLFYKFECCGVENYMDINNAKDFQKTNPNYETIPFCCKDITFEYPNLNAPPNDPGFDCAINPTPENSNYMKGCFQTMKDFLSTYQNLFLGVGISLLVIELLCIIAACCICREIGDADGKMV